MSGPLDRLIARARGPLSAVRPVVPSRYEPSADASRTGPRPGGAPQDAAPADAARPAVGRRATGDVSRVTVEAESVVEVGGASAGPFRAADAFGSATGSARVGAAGALLSGAPGSAPAVNRQARRETMGGDSGRARPPLEVEETRPAGRGNAFADAAAIAPLRTGGGTI